MTFTTDDGYKLSKGSKIYYTGDMANTDGYFLIDKIELCNWYGLKITLREIEGQNRRKFNLTPMSFNTGLGRRFKPIQLVEKERKQAMMRLQKMVG